MTIRSIIKQDTRRIYLRAYFERCTFDFNKASDQVLLQTNLFPDLGCSVMDGYLFFYCTLPQSERFSFRCWSAPIFQTTSDAAIRAGSVWADMPGALEMFE
jgi:hypothetical protein